MTRKHGNSCKQSRQARVKQLALRRRQLKKSVRGATFLLPRQKAPPLFLDEALVVTSPPPLNYRRRLLSEQHKSSSTPARDGSTERDTDSDPYRLRAVYGRHFQPESDPDNEVATSPQSDYGLRLNGHNVIHELVASSRPTYNFLRATESSDESDVTDLSDSDSCTPSFYSSFEVSRDQSMSNRCDGMNDTPVSYVGGVAVSGRVFEKTDSGMVILPGSTRSDSDNGGVSLTPRRGQQKIQSDDVGSTGEDLAEALEITEDDDNEEVDVLPSSGTEEEDETGDSVISGDVSSTSWEDITDKEPIQNEKEDVVLRKEQIFFSQNCRFHKMDNENILLVLTHPISLPLAGLCSIRVLWGQLYVHGHVIGANSQQMSLYSPMSHSRLVLHTHQSDENDTRSAPSPKEQLAAWHILLPKGMSAESKEALNREYNAPGTVGVWCATLNDRRCEYLQRYFGLFDLYRAAENAIESLRVESSYKFCFALPSGVSCLRESEDWRAIVSDIATYSKRNGEQPRVIVTGGKNVGKSTMCRHILNCLLNSHKEVCFMEGDPAQSEFTPPGMLYLVNVTQPCFGPGFTHLQNPLLSVFMGAANVGDAPQHYKMCTEKLWEFYNQNTQLSEHPLVINTMGFNRGLGLGLLLNLVHMTRPTHVIQLASGFKGRNNLKFTYEYLSNSQGWNMPYQDIVFPYQHYFIKSEAISDKFFFSPRELRQINLMSYLSSFQKSDLEFEPLNQLPMYKVPWSLVGLHVCHRDVPNSHIMHAYNASIVALCRCDPSEMVATEDESLPKFITKLPVCEWFGYGIVRAISMQRKCFYVITDLPATQLAKVNALLKGDVELPKKLMVEQVVSGCIPYLCQSRGPNQDRPAKKLALGNTRVAPRTFRLNPEQYREMFKK